MAATAVTPDGLVWVRFNETRVIVGFKFHKLGGIPALSPVRFREANK